MYLNGLKHKPNPAMKERILRDAKRLEEQMKPHEAEQPVRNQIAIELPVKVGKEIMPIFNHSIAGMRS